MWALPLVIRVIASEAVVVVGALLSGAVAIHTVVNETWWLRQAADALISHASGGQFHWPSSAQDAMSQVGRVGWDVLTQGFEKRGSISASAWADSAEARMVAEAARRAASEGFDPRLADLLKAAALQEALSEGPGHDINLADWLTHTANQTGLSQTALLIRLFITKEHQV
jgi:hypothetical protein